MSDKIISKLLFIRAEERQLPRRNDAFSERRAWKRRRVKNDKKKERKESRNVHFSVFVDRNQRLLLRFYFTLKFSLRISLETNTTIALKLTKTEHSIRLVRTIEIFEYVVDDAFFVLHFFFFVLLLNCFLFCFFRDGMQCDHRLYHLHTRTQQRPSIAGHNKNNIFDRCKMTRIAMRTFNVKDGDTEKVN